MKRETKTHLSGVAVLAGLFVIGSLMQSRESQANGAYSTPVTVMNTNANPASTLDAVIASRIPYVSTVSFGCGPGVTTPPSGELSFNNGVFPVWGFSGIIGPTHPNTIVRFVQAVKAYADPADGQPLVREDGNWANVPQTVTLTGYLLNCSLTPCPAIQH
jgi:hypothetical protein